MRLDSDGETVQKAYGKKVGKYDQLRRRTHGTMREGWVHSFLDGASWDRVASEAFWIPMRVIYKRRDLTDVQLTYEPAYEQENVVKATSFKRLQTGSSYSVDINLQYGEQCIPMKVTNSIPPSDVDARARVMLGLGVELDEARPAIWPRVGHASS
jgi:hypothetical protein